MAEKQENDGLTDPLAEKPKRGRKRKTAAESEAVEVAATQADTEITLQSKEQGPEEQSIPALDSQHETPSATLSEATAGDILTSEHTKYEAAKPKWHSACGGALKAAREARGLSIPEVCKQLRLGVNQIQAIEQDDFAKLPQNSIVRGFIRNYARLLKIDAEPVLAAYQQMVPDSAPAALSVKSNASQSVIQSKAQPWRPTRLLNPLLLLLVLSVLTYFYVVHVKPETLNSPTQTLNAGSETTQASDNPPESATSASESSEVAPAPPVETPVQTEVTPETNATPVSETENSKATLASTPSASITSVANTVVTSPTPASETTASTTIKAIDPSKVTLLFKVTEESWVRVENMQGQKLFSQVLAAGAEQLMTVDKPVNITVGNANVTKLSIDNQPYDLTQATRGRVARVQLK